MKLLSLLASLVLLCSASFGADTPLPLVADSDYLISSRDSIQFQIYNQLDMTTIQRVSASGEIRLPLVGTVKVAQLTLRDAEHMIERLYREGGFFIHPQVILAVQLYGDRFVSVLGQVKEPARIPLASETNTIGILQAITQVGGFTRVARTDAVQVLRTGPDGQDQRLSINTDDLLHPNAASRTPEFQLKPGDVVFVPERVF